ncbi:hypothetical protein BGX27_005208 [Mortierella sp. AM989]|nr:hypothetical protein BGX27_005208 [Mortierella sp. AM989]
MNISGSPRRKKNGDYEQVLLDEITAVFGPHIEDISMTQDLYKVKEQQYYIWPSSPSSQPPVERKLSEEEGFGDPSTPLIVTTQVLQQDPRIHIGRWFHLHWLRELQIVFRATGDKPFFLQSSDEQEPQLPKVIDFTPCETLESLTIEDLDHNGQPQQLLRQQALGSTDIVPFDQDQGIKLPSRLKSLEMIGYSANRFNFGWLRATSSLESLQILGPRCFVGSATLGAYISLWRWEGVNLPSLKQMIIHHSPARHFRFEILYQCPQLEFLDIRDVPLYAFRVPRIDLHFQGSGHTRDTNEKFGSLRKCRIDVLPSPGGLSPDIVYELHNVLQNHLLNVEQLCLYGIPENVVKEAIDVLEMTRLEQLLTKEKK